MLLEMGFQKILSLRKCSTSSPGPRFLGRDIVLSSGKRFQTRKSRKRSFWQMAGKKERRSRKKAKPGGYHSKREQHKNNDQIWGGTACACSHFPVRSPAH